MHDLLPLAVILTTALIGGRIAVRFGFPAILGEILAGILIGPAAFGLVGTTPSVEVLGEVGVLLMMLSIGMHIDPRALRRASGTGLAAAVGGFVLPLGLGTALMLVVGRTPTEAFFVGLAMGVTSLVVNARILVDLRILDTRIAYVLMAGALLSDLVVLVAMTALLDGGTPSPASIARFVGFGVAAWVVGSHGLPFFFKRIASLGWAASSTAVMGIAFFFSWAAEAAGLHAILGAFIAGVFMTEHRLGADVARRLRGPIDVVGLGILAPIFFVSVGFEVTLDVFGADLRLLLAVIALATVGKVAGTVIAYLVTGRPWREALVVGAGMNGRGAVEIIVAQVALDRGIIGQDVFSILVVMAIVTTASVPVLLTRGVGWLTRRGELERVGTRSGTLIVGAGPVARVLARVLRTSGVVRLIDTNPGNQASAVQEGLEVLGGSAFESAVLTEAGIDEVNTVIALTANVEANLLIARIAVQRGVPNVSAFVPDDDMIRLARVVESEASRVLPGPVDLLEWDLAVTHGTVGERLIVVEVPTTVTGIRGLIPARDANEDLLAIAVVSANGRRPWTDDVTLTPGDEIVVLTRSLAPTGASKGPLNGNFLDRPESPVPS